MTLGGGGGWGSRTSGLKETGLIVQTLNTGRTRRVQGNFRQPTFGLVMFRTSNGPIYMGDNFVDSFCLGNSLVDFHILFQEEQVEAGSWVLWPSLEPSAQKSHSPKKEKGWLVSKIPWQYLCRQSIVRILHPWKEGGTGGWVGGDHTMKGVFQVLVCQFSLTLWLQVVSRSKGDSGSSRGTEGLPHCIDEVGAMVWNSIWKQSICTEYFHDWHICCLFGWGQESRKVTNNY